MSQSTRAAQKGLPGMSLPIDYSVDEEFPTALRSEDDLFLFKLTFLREFFMLEVMDQITDKPNWDEKVFDDTITEKWTAEALASNDDCSKKMMDYVIAEVRAKTKEYRETGLVALYTGDVVKTDSAVSEQLKQALRNAVKVLEDVPVKKKDWHPDSDEKVLDLVHPSLFPLIYGRSRVVEDSASSVEESFSQGGGEIIPYQPEVEDTDNNISGWRRRTGTHKPFSHKFQWLPCDVKISKSDNGKIESKITSYINNLHPHQHPELYKIIEEVISCAIPSWNRTLSGIGKIEDQELRIKVPDANIYKMDKDAYTEEHGPKPEEGEDEWGDEHQDRVEEWAQNIDWYKTPEPEEFNQEDYFAEYDRAAAEGDNVDLVREFGDTGLQVIVKLANIHLTPEKPNYDGGSWHIEGQKNEHIVATALYYYDVENITDSYLAFRQVANPEIDYDEIMYEQNDHRWLPEWFGCENEEAAVQEVGSTLCRENRLLTFPNVLQHRVQPFELLDPTKPGHRKILCLFLVDPHIKIISTANVPPQQREWWSEELLRTGGFGRVLKLPAELQANIMDNVDYPIMMEEAKELRLKLMEERKALWIVQDDHLRSGTFSLCEH